jgi:site-specific recombinase XerD
MDQGYNLYNLEALFKNYLNAEINSRITIKNYLSDLRHFIGWAILKLPREAWSHSAGKIEEITSEEFVSLIESQLIEEYKQYLITNNIPPKTINRRLSTLRKFFAFCISQGWRKDNPAKKVANYGVVNDSQAVKDEQNKKLIFDFKKYLSDKKKFNLDEINNISENINEFLNFISFFK